ncbi:ABC transporter permease [Gammaproteobacteria bacterium]|nr:ABC transporter permease [Gammaproteobacteria bacterium]
MFDWLKSDGFRDIVRGAREYHIWAPLAWLEIRSQYSRSFLGPFWITLSTLALVLTFGLLYAQLFNLPWRDHLGYVVLGITTWTYISALFLRGCEVFANNASMILQLRKPLSFYVYRLTALEFFIMLHNLLVALVIFFVVGHMPSIGGILMSVFGLLIVTLTIFMAALAMGVLSTRFRDVPPVVDAIIRPMMFITPIVWDDRSLPGRAALVDYNPFHHMVSVVRNPMIGREVEWFSWMVVLLVFLMSSAAAIGLFVRYRGRLAYWV